MLSVPAFCAHYLASYLDTEYYSQVQLVCIFFYF